MDPISRRLSSFSPDYDKQQVWRLNKGQTTTKNTLFVPTDQRPGWCRPGRDGTAAELLPGWLRDSIVSQKHQGSPRPPQRTRPPEKT